MNRPSEVVIVDQVTHYYKQQIALSNITLSITKGTIAGLIGPDGVGKSTLLGLVAGVKKIQHGEVHLFSQNIQLSAVRNQLCHRIAYMPQGLGKNLYATLSVYENLRFFSQLFGQNQQQCKQHIEELLLATGLAPFAKRPAGKLSGGMKQKLGLCCALIHDPDLLILDEPTTGVDPLSRMQFWELITRIKSRTPDMTILVATAYMEEAERYDWLAALYGGRLLATGSPKVLCEQTQTTSLDEAFKALQPECTPQANLIIPPYQQNSKPVAIEAAQLTKRFGDFTAVDQVNFQIYQGEIFGFLGSNGCGKTTTMKMLTGLLPPTEGKATLFGEPMNSRSLSHRKNIGFMSQSFSLYQELTVKQNLLLHARLFQLPSTEANHRINELLSRMSLTNVADEQTADLPLGIKQRLSLAVAIIHRPKILILDEPTSGVDPIARDQFWQLLVELSRNENVTIFISTHFMNEAERCDRISLMHAGKVLAAGTAEVLISEKQATNLEAAFIRYLQESKQTEELQKNQDSTVQPPQKAIASPKNPIKTRSLSWQRLWAYAQREAMEIQRDPIRFLFALLGPIFLLIVMGYGISMDVKHMKYAVLDRDQTQYSRHYLEAFEGSKYFQQQLVISNDQRAELALVRGEVELVIEVPPQFGRQMLKGESPEVGIWIDGAMPFRAETIRGYVQGVHQNHLQQLAKTNAHATPQQLKIEPRFRYNQSIESIYAIVPGVMATLLTFIPAMLMAVAVVREKELGSITNYYATPTTHLEFLWGKQLPYIALSIINFMSLFLVTWLFFGVPIKGSFSLLFVGSCLYVIATTALGLLISTFTTTQVAALFGTLIITIIPSINFSGLISPVASLSGGASIMSTYFPAAYYLDITVGIFTKATSWADLKLNFAAVIGFFVTFTLLSVLFLPKQER
ncbi:ribosome-associated ATPase/putative transporter RbbA [Zooshikella marina]|uniref:ribosome-associated ATPase/putative transporter RbbA n=1 Tax=Zooshikella ganghwensis TaxID=202772 RepID=UPI001BAF3303|nr:ribosome-associated ATPase/putative transporter RbbA [Zooshikella ganghwensis]MBU2705846.1 ribosome-associated ATPase/putative transporter RbbA [Zooshikella ganghwensis]